MPIRDSISNDCIKAYKIISGIRRFLPLPHP
uniref:Uncharacterized protein n=1 Tax=Wuchereria bancrofti TaxID=6293 RepID=A0AAF5PQ68_WUCBA